MIDDDYNLKLDSFDELANMLQYEENKKNNVRTNQSEKTSLNKSVQSLNKQHTLKVPMVMSLDDFEEKVKNGNLQISTKIKNNSNIKENVKRNKHQKIKKVRKSLIRQTRYTEPKKRNILSRIILHKRLLNGYFDFIQENINDEKLTQEEIIKLKNSSQKSDKKIYKKVQAYEDARDDVAIKKGWLSFKIGLATATIAGSLVVGSYALNEIKSHGESNDSQIQIVSAYENEKNSLESYVKKLKTDIIENDGYHFEILSDREIADGYNKIMDYEKKLNEDDFNISVYELLKYKDQEILSQIVSNSFGKDYNNFTDVQKSEYKQLAYELLPYALPEYFKDGTDYIRNPIVIKEASASKIASYKGYDIKLTVNNDEKETLKNLGNLIYFINKIEQKDYIDASLSENAQQKFFDTLLRNALGKNYDRLEKKYKRDYNQIIYEWLPEEGKKYIKDPIEVEKENSLEEQSDGMELIN